MKSATRTPNSNALRRAVEAVTFLFAAFSGFLGRVAPPDEVNPEFATGLASLATLAILLAISSVARRASIEVRRKRWLRLGLCSLAISISTGIAYTTALDRFTFPYPPEATRSAYVRGISYTPAAARWADEGLSSAEIVAKFGGLKNRDLVWSSRSLQNARMLLLLNYLIFVLGMATAIFCFAEAQS